MRRGALEKCFGRLFIEDARVDRSVIQFTERKQRCQCNAPVAASEGAVGQQGEQKRRHFVGKRRIGLASKGRDLRPLDGIDETELRFDYARMCLRSSELDAHCAMEIDQVLNGEITNAAVNR